MAKSILTPFTFAIGGNTITNATNIVGLKIVANASQSVDIFQIRNSADSANIFSVGNAGAITTASSLAVSGQATFNQNATGYGTLTQWANQQLAIAARTGQNWAGNLVQFSLNDTTVVGGVGSRGNIFMGSTGGIGTNAYNLSATNPFVSSTQATFTVSTNTPGGAQPFAVGQKIKVNSASQAQYNGDWIVTAVGGVNGAWTATVTSGSGTTPFTNGGALTATGNITVEPMASFKANAPSVVPLSIMNGGTSGNATDMFRLYDSAGNLRTYFTSSGDLVVPALQATWQTDSRAQDRNVSPIRARFTVSNAQANTQTWESSTAVYAGINARGQFFTGGTLPVRGSRTIAIPAHTPTGTTDITLTLSATHNIGVGQTVEVAGVTPAGYNGVWRAQNGTTGSTLVLNIGSNPGPITVAGVAYISPQVSIVPDNIASSGLIIKALASQAANLAEFQSSSGAVLARVTSAGILYASQILSLNGLASMGEFNNGAIFELVRGTAQSYSPGLNRGTLYFRDGTTSGTLRLATRTGVSGVEETIVDNISSTGSTAGAQFTGAGGVVTTGTLTSAGLVLSSTTSPITLNGSVGTSGQVLTSAGAGATPTWTTVSGGSFTGGTLTSDLVLAAGSTTVEPLTFQSNSSTPTTTSGAMDYDGTVFYQTSNTNPGRALNSQYYYYASSSDYGPDFSTSGSVQSMLGAATRGITVAAGTTYEYEFYATVQHQYINTTGITGTYQITNTTVSGSPTVAVVHQIDYGSNTTNFTTATTLSTIRTTTSVVFSAAISSGSRYNFIRANGVIRVTGTGTTKLYPGLSLSAASGDNIWNIQNGLVFKLTPIGDGTVTNVGTWS